MKVDNSNSIGVSKSCSIPIPVKAIDWYDFEMAADPDLGWKNKKEEIEGLCGRRHLHFCIRCPKQEIKLGFRRCHAL